MKRIGAAGKEHLHTTSTNRPAKVSIEANLQTCKTLVGSTVRTLAGSKAKPARATANMTSSSNSKEEFFTFLTNAF